MALIKILGITEEDGVCLILGTLITFLCVAALVFVTMMGGGWVMSWFH
jgi:hypothetical protein